MAKSTIWLFAFVFLLGQIASSALGDMAQADPLFRQVRAVYISIGVFTSDDIKFDRSVVHRELGDKLAKKLSDSLKQHAVTSVLISSDPIASARSVRDPLAEQNLYVQFDVQMANTKNTDQYAIVLTTHVGRLSPQIAPDDNIGAPTPCNCQFRSWSEVRIRGEASVNTTDKLTAVLYQDFVRRIADSLIYGQRDQK